MELGAAYARTMKDLESERMKNNLFREKSIERISSPEQLNEYIRVSTPSVWMLLIAIVVLLAGVCVWGVAGRLETTLSAAAVAGEGGVVAYVRGEEAAAIKAGMEVSIGDERGSIASIADQPVRVDDGFTQYMRHVGSLQDGEWVYAVELDISCPEGVYRAEIITESVSPISFVLN